MDSVMDASGKPKSRNLSANWYDMSIREKERQMVAIHWKFTSPKLDFEFRSDGGSNLLTESGSTSSGNEEQQDKIPATKLLYIRTIQGHTGDMISYLQNAKSLYSIEDDR